MTSSPFRIAIIGAGPAGLTLGLLLQRWNIPFTIFELRPRPTDAELAEPAGRLDLHTDSGLAALNELGLIDEFNTMIDDCSEEAIVADKHGTILYADPGQTSNRESRPEISRNKLTKLLLSHLPDSAIRWKHKLVSASRSLKNESVEVELDFGDDGQHQFDFVIGADGAWSRIRTLLTDVRPTYAGQHNITLNIRQITASQPHLSKLVGGGSFFALGDRHGVISQRAAQDTARLYVFITTEDENFAVTHGLRNKTPAQVKSILFDDINSPLRGFGGVVKELVETACDNETTRSPDNVVDIRPMYTLYGSSDHSWEHKSGVTVVGDAAHLMPPNGEGVNIAMKDSLLLAQAIAKAYDTNNQDGSSIAQTLDSLIEKFEEDMLARARTVRGETVELREMMFDGENCSQIMADFFKSAAA